MITKPELQFQGDYVPPKIVPRVIVELGQEDLIEMISTPQGQKGSLDAIIQEVEKYKYDGIVSSEKHE